MLKGKILVGLALLGLILLMLPLSSNTPPTPIKSQVAVATHSFEETLYKKKEAKTYRLHQQELQQALQAYFEKAIEDGEIIGAGVSIVKGDSILISEGFGKKNINQEALVDGQTIFRLGSLSKGFAGVLAADLKSEGILDWNTKIADYLPNFQLGDRENTRKVTLGNILSHTAGTPYHSYTNLVEAGLPLETIAQRFKDVAPIGQPGSVYSYQNAIFALCGEIIQKATGQEIATALSNRFFNPLGMSSTCMDHETLTHTENVALPHTQRQKNWKALPLTDNYYNAIAAGGINASPLDMAKWMRFLLGHNPELMDKEALKEAFEPYIELKGRSKYYQKWPGHKSSYYAYGWRVHKFVEENSDVTKTMWHHGGSVNNFRNEIAVFPEADLGICVLLNSNSLLAQKVIPDLHRIVKEIYRPTPQTIAHNDRKTTYIPSN